MTAPRPGSTIDLAQRALRSAGCPLPRAELARLIEREDDELDSLLRYGVRMGLLVRSNGDEDVSYAPGDGVPVEIEARPAETEVQPVPRGPAAKQEGADDDDEGDRGRARRLAGEGDAGAAGLGRQRRERERHHRAPEHEAGLLRALAPRAAREGNAESVAQAPAEARPGAYRPRPGSDTDKLLTHLCLHAPHGGSVWLSAAELAASGADQRSVQPSLMAALKHGAAITIKDPGCPRTYKAGPAAPVVAGCSPAPAAPAPAPAAAASEPRRGAAGTAPVATPVPAASQATTAPSGDDLVSFLRSQLETEIARLEHNLRMVRRRKEAFELAIEGARPAWPQHALRNGGASVAFRTEGS